MISSLPSNRSSESSDPFSFTGKVALAVGTGYGISKTLNEGGAPSFSSVRAGRNLRNRVGNLLNVETPGFTSTPSAVKFTTLGDIVSGPRRGSFVSFTHAVNSLTGATSGLSTQGTFLNEFQGLVSDLEGKFGYKNQLTFEEFRSGDKLLEMRVKPRGASPFVIRPVTGSGDMFFGDKGSLRYSARQVLDVGRREVTDLSTAILREQRNRLPELVSNFGATGFKPSISPESIARKGLDQAIFEGVGGSGNSLSKYQVSIDPFGKYASFPGSGDANFALLKRLVGEGLIEPGSPSMTAKGIGFLPGSPLSEKLGASLSPVGKQYFRESEFLSGGRTPSVAQPFSNLRQFNLGVVDSKKFSQFQQAASGAYGAASSKLSEAEKAFFSQRRTVANLRRGVRTGTSTRAELREAQNRLNTLRGDFKSASQTRAELERFKDLNFGELAEEEFILNKNNNIRISNQIYQPEIDLSNKGTQISTDFDQLLNQIGTEKGLTRAQLLSEMEKPGGLQGLNVRANRGMVLGLGPENIGGERKSVALMNNLDQYIAGLMVTDKQTLKVAVRTEYQMDLFQKVFGAFKGTAKASGNVPSMLADFEVFQTHGRFATSAELGNLTNKYKNVDFIVNKHPFGTYMNQGVLPGKEAPALFDAALLSAAETNTPFAQRFLTEMGFENAGGQWKNTGKLASDEALRRFQGFASQNGAELNSLLGENLGGATMVRGIISPELHRFQMGVGQKAGLSQRAFFNVASMFPESIGSELAGRLEYPMGRRPQDQLRELLNYRSIIADGAAESIPLNRLESQPSLLNDLFSPDLNVRRAAIEQATGTASNSLSINLGRDIIPEGAKSPVRNVVISANDILDNFTGTQIGSSRGSLTPMDEAGLDLVNAARSFEADPYRAKEAAARYTSAMDQAIGSTSENLFRGQFKGSVYGQAQSELPGMRSFVERSLGKNPEGLLPPVVALHSRDIARAAGQLGMEPGAALSMAREGKLFGLVSREPAEGIHRTSPHLIGVAEDLGQSQGYHRGAVYFGGQDEAYSAMRKSLGVDFDADQTSVILFTNENAQKTFREFLVGGESQVAAIGAEFRRTQRFFDVFKLKGQITENVLGMPMGDIHERLLEIGKTEKKLIGPLSSNLEDVHTGFRDMILRETSPEALSRAFKGEAAVLLLAESSLKAKHRATSSLRRSEDILGALSETDQAKFTSQLQGHFDSMTFGDSDLGARLRGSSGVDASLLDEVRGSMGLESSAAAEEFASTYTALTGNQTMGDIHSASRRGKHLRERGMAQSILSEAGDAGGNLKSTLSKAMNQADIFASEINPFVNRGLKNILKWGILPAAGIGLLGTMMDDEPGVLPVELSSREHENTGASNQTVAISKDVYAQPRKERYKLSGRVTQLPDPSLFTSAFGSSSVNLNVNDYRSHMSQDKVDRMVKRGI